jgi:hypothetical protein
MRLHAAIQAEKASNDVLAILTVRQSRYGVLGRLLLPSSKRDPSGLTSDSRAEF